MTNAELIAKIKAEIERQMYKNPEVEYDNGFNDALEYLLSFLDTLEEETSYDTQKYTPRPCLLNDQIDEWIFEKLGLIPGCCSSILELEYNIAREVAEALWSKNDPCNEKTLDGKVKLQLTIVRDND